MPVIVNRSGGTASARGAGLEDELKHAFAEAGRAIELELVDGSDVAAAIQRHAHAPRIVVGGGDGTIGHAAGIVAHTGAELAVLPLGTRNHFARQLSIPLDITDAVRVAAKDAGIAIDLGDAGGRTFINNASFGAYVDLVRERENSSLPKWLASIVAGWRVLRRLRPRDFDLHIDGVNRPVRTTMLFVGNNVYEVESGRPTERQALDDGLLSVFAIAPLKRGAVLRAALRVALRRPDLQHDFALVTTAREVVLQGSGLQGVALDGERLQLPRPLTLAVRPRALRVVVPHT